MAEPVTIPQGGFSIPPAGGPAVPVPGAPAGTQMPPAGGNPIYAPGQFPGWVAPPAGVPGALPGQPVPTPTPPPVGGAPTGTPTPQGQPDTNAALAALLAALAPQGGEPTGEPTEDSAAPAWMPKDLNQFDIQGIDDPIIKSMASVLQASAAGLDLNRIIGKAVAHGDPALIDYAYLHEKGGKTAPQIADIAKGIVNAINARAEGITQSVHATVGGEANWNQAVAVFNQSAPPEIRLTVATMLDSTNEAQIKAAAKIVAEYGKVSGMVTQRGTPGFTTVPGNVSAQALSKAQFQHELQKLDKYAPEYGEQREQLFARRALGKRAGIN